MIILILIYCLLFSSCFQEKINQNKSENVDNNLKQTLVVLNHKLENDNNQIYDSIKIRFISFTAAVDALIIVQKEKDQLLLDVSNLQGGYKKQIRSDNVAYSQLIQYINRFYIEKEKIIFSKKKTGYITAADYPVITVKLFKKGDVVLEQENRIGSETHKVEYNPKFIEFYEFLEELVSE